MAHNGGDPGEFEPARNRECVDRRVGHDDFGDAVLDRAGDGHGARGIRRGAERDAAACGRVIDGIAEQVGEDALDERRVCRDP